VKIKVCGLFDQANLKEVLSLKPDFIGLNFYQNSKRYCKLVASPDLDYGQTKLVGVFVNAAAQEIVERAKSFKLSLLQLHGTESKDDLVTIREGLPNLEIIKVFGVEGLEDLEDLESWQNYADYFLFDKKAISFGGTGKKFNWDLLNKNPPKKQFFLAGGIGPEDIRALKILSEMLPDFFAVDINSCFEDKTGLKNVQSIQNFIEELRK
jgi:phosphoribosylanthranilate isomerase